MASLPDSDHWLLPLSGDQNTVKPLSIYLRLANAAHSFLWETQMERYRLRLYRSIWVKTVVFLHIVYPKFTALRHCVCVKADISI